MDVNEHPTPSLRGQSASQPRTVREMAARVFDLTNELNAAFETLQAEVKRRRSAGISDERTLREIDASADTPERKVALAQVERVLKPKQSAKPPGVSDEAWKRAGEYARGERPVR